MKLDGLKKLVKEELSKALNENIQANFIGELTPGKYKVDYKYKYLGDIDFDEVTITVTDKDIEMDGNVSIQNFTNAEIPLGKVVGIRSIEKVG